PSVVFPRGRASQAVRSQAEPGNEECVPRDTGRRAAKLAFPRGAWERGVTMSSLVSLFLDHVADEGDRPALHVKQSGSFVPVTWNELARDVRRVAAMLRRLGVTPGERVVQLSENRYEW